VPIPVLAPYLTTNEESVFTQLLESDDPYSSYRNEPAIFIKHNDGRNFRIIDMTIEEK
jgi:hypothetical protein